MRVDVLVLVLLLIALFAAGCRRVVYVDKVVEVQVPGPARMCVEGPAPKNRSWAYPIEGGICPEGYACVTPEDAQSQADELEERRRFDERVVCPKGPAHSF